ncbi:hypothetical protein Dip510_000356 [Elusimicrobium posterum]|uniref:metallophosphoesterase n=1 Tax=Elusimicrobium posterum TaxID=3116653 RepID=UPI003C70A5AF
MSKITRVLLWVLPITGPLLIVLTFGLNRRAESEWAGIVTLIGHFWTGIIFLLFAVCFVMLLTHFGLSLFKIDAKSYIAVTGLTIFVLLSVAAIAGGYQDPAVRNVNFKDQSLPVDKLSIVQISDTHLGTGVNIKRVERLVQQVNALNPDLILVTGDFFENGSEELMKENAKALRKMKAKYGIYGSLGNHEFYRGLDQSVKFFEAAGVTLLRQQSVEVKDGIVVAGVDDFNTTRTTKKDFVNYLDTLDKDKFNIIMAHEPKYFKAASGKMNLMLCGHTHNGQIWPFNFLVKTRYRHVYGLYKKGPSHYYVTSGTFYWGPPMRLLSRSEIPYIIVEK